MQKTWSGIVAVRFSDCASQASIYMSLQPSSPHNTGITMTSQEETIYSALAAVFLTAMEGVHIPEAILKSPRDVLEVPHPTSSGGLSPLSLLSPLVRTDFSRWKHQGILFMATITRMNPRRADPRLLLLPPDTFKGKRVLDIGCNEGWVTIDIAQRFSPAKIIGVDIDASLIGGAWKRRRFIWSLQNTSPSTTDATSPSGSEHDQSARSKKRKRMDSQNTVSRDPTSAFFSNVELSPDRSDVFAYFPQSMEYMFGPLSMPPPSSKNVTPEIHHPFPHNVTFYTADWMKSTRNVVLSNEAETGQAESSNAAMEKEDREGYDVVLARSNLRPSWDQGDEAIPSRFSQMSDLEIHLASRDDVMGSSGPMAPPPQKCFNASRILEQLSTKLQSSKM
ncbi:10403_t:CDS:2, partial [Acaulospora colombiana]